MYQQENYWERCIDTFCIHVQRFINSEKYEILYYIVFGQEKPLVEK